MTKAYFFQAITALQLEGVWQLTIKTTRSNRVLVSVLFNKDTITDTAQKMIPPLVLKGTAEELDEGFFASIETPVRQTAGLLLNMEEHAKALEAAKQQSKMEQGNRQQGNNEQSAGAKKYEAQMRKVTELEKAEKYREACGQLPKVTDFPEYEEAINERKAELMGKFSQPSLF